MTISSRISRAFANGIQGGMNTWYATPYRNASLAVATPQDKEASNAELLDTLLGYYFSNGLYQTLNLVGAGAENTNAYQKIKSIRNPVSAFVSFYQFKLFPNPLIPVLPKSDKDAQPNTDATAPAPPLLQRIDEIWKRSAWLRIQPRAAFHYSLFGELFIRAGARASDNAPILQLVDPRHVTELDLDERGYIQWIRIEYPYAKRDPQTGKETERYYIEVWQKDENGARRRVWDLDRKLVPVDTLPRDPMIDHSTTETGKNNLAIDFVPIAYAPFVSVDNGRGMSPILSALEDIDEANRMATRLHAMLFRGGRTTWAASANYVTPDGRQAPPPLITPDNSQIDLDDGDSIFKLPGNATLTSLVPSLPYADALAILQNHMDWIAENKLFELGYYKTSTGTEESGRARAYRLEAALNRGKMARATVLDTLERADQMCCTLGQALSVKGYSAAEIGTFDNGDFDHTFRPQDMLTVSTEEMAATAAVLIGTAQAEPQAAYQAAGFGEDESIALASLGIPPEQ